MNADGHREVLGLKVATGETGQAWHTFFADLVARGLSGLVLVNSDAHLGLVDAIAAHLPPRGLAALQAAVKLGVRGCGRFEGDVTGYNTNAGRC